MPIISDPRLAHLPRSAKRKIRIDDEVGCWDWIAFVDHAGYGSFWFQGRQQKAHRVIYEELVGPIPAGLQLDHLCRNRRCVNPEHLEPVTCAENVRRGVESRGLAVRCGKGHEMTPENTIVRVREGGGPRECRTCKAIRSRARCDQRLRDASRLISGVRPDRSVRKISAP